MIAPTTLRLVAAEEHADALTTAAAVLVEGLVNAGFDVTAEPTDLELAYFALVPVLRKLGVVDVDPTAEPAPGAFLNCVRAAAAIRRTDRRRAQWRNAGRWECQHGLADVGEPPCTECLPPEVAA